MFGNEGDRPYLLKATPETVAAMAAAIATLKPMIKRPFGVDYLWDPVGHRRARRRHRCAPSGAR